MSSELVMQLMEKAIGRDEIMKQIATMEARGGREVLQEMPMSCF